MHEGGPNRRGQTAYHVKDPKAVSLRTGSHSPSSERYSVSARMMIMLSMSSSIRLIASSTVCCRLSMSSRTLVGDNLTPDNSFANMTCFTSSRGDSKGEMESNNRSAQSLRYDSLMMSGWGAMVTTLVELCGV